MCEIDYWETYLENARQDQILREEYSSALVELGEAKRNGDAYDIADANMMAGIRFSVLLGFVINRLDVLGDNHPELERI